MTRFAGWVEIARAADGALPIALIVEWYQRSREHPIAFLLNDVEPAEVDRVLDPLIPYTLHYAGVVYVKKADVENVAAVANFTAAPERPPSSIDPELPVDNAAA
jgi:hypothetical protein